MRMTYHLPLTNDILAGLPSAEANSIKTHLRRVRLVSGQVLIEPGHAVEHVYFVEDGLASLVVEAHGKRSGVEVAMIGRDGLVGIDSLLGAALAARAAAIVQIPGQAMRMASRDLRRLCAECPELRRRCLNAASALFQQVMETSACNARNSLAERCARWLLMAHERVDNSDIHITHEALSMVLGVRRSGVSVVLAGLQESGIITVHRGRIAVRDRAGLEDVSNRTGAAGSAMTGGTVFETRVPSEPQSVHRGERSFMMDAGRLS